ncbi:MAG: hypothetical protein DRP02_02265 [Candidatus Gerdarchaeota archaeon]|nr:MAG: hypothetical protein DRP02_02265 [Candidatus Gerdarchaeota archaeon]
MSDMTELQILALKDEQVEKILKYRKAQEGFKLLERPTEPEYEAELEKDVTFYSVGSLNGYRFTKVEEANAVSHAIREAMPSLVYYSRYSSSPRVLSKMDSYDRKEASTSVSSEKFFSPALVEAAKQIEKRNDEAKKGYAEQKAEYEKYVEDVQWLIDEVWNRVFEIRRKYEKLARLQTDYSEYLVLANNDEKIATAFMKKANAITDEELKIIKGKKIN